MLFLGIIVALAAALWLGVLLQHGRLPAACLLILLCGACFGHPFVHVSVITSDRVLWGIMVIMYAVARASGAIEAKPWSWLDQVFVGFLAVLTLSTFTNHWMIDGAQPASRWLFLYMMPAGIYWVARQMPLTTNTIRAIWTAGAGFGTYLALTAIAEVTSLRAFIFPSYIRSSAFPEFLGRGRGPFLNPSANGIYLTTALGCWATFWSRVARQRQVWIFVGMSLIGLGAVATLTRCVWMGVILAILVVCRLTLPLTRQLGIVLILVSVGTLGVSVAWDQLIAFKRDKNVSVSEMQESAKLRPMLAYVAWQMILDHPFCGVGLGQYKSFDGPYIAAREVDLPLERVRPYHQHNVILSLMTETGLLGTIPFLTLLFGWSQVAWRLWRSTKATLEQRQIGMVYLVCLSGYLANGMFQDVSIIPMVNALVFFVAGLLMSAGLSTGVIAPSRIPRWASLRTWTVRRPISTA